nr:MAG TPA: hypothetical protein [Caudoviricetes sp.]
MVLLLYICAVKKDQRNSLCTHKSLLRSYYH